jgi:hypothetical protein
LEIAGEGDYPLYVFQEDQGWPAGVYDVQDVAKQAGLFVLQAITVSIHGEALARKAGRDQVYFHTLRFSLGFQEACEGAHIAVHGSGRQEPAAHEGSQDGLAMVVDLAVEHRPGNAA